MDKFVGRNAELKYLEQYYHSDDSRILVVYGSPGIGKTRLLQEFCKEKKNSYYLARACSAAEQRYQWAMELKSEIEIDNYPSWEQLFSAAMGSLGEKQVLVLDEFQHIFKADDMFFPTLCTFVEKKKAGSVMVVLCTSASGWVENSMVDKMGAGVAKISGFLKVRELSFGAIRHLFPAFGSTDALMSYAVLGGIPGYWKNFSEKLTAKENIIANILARESRLYQEMSVFLEQELREPAVYNTILAALARDCCKLNDIYKHTGFSRAKISVYLKILMELDLVEKVYSYESQGHVNARKGIYRISNPYVRFYFRYLFPNQSLLQMVSPEDFYLKKVEDNYLDFAEETYRKICREQIKTQYRTVSEWLGKTGNLDIVAVDAKGEICVAACSYARKITVEDYEWLLFSVKKAKINVNVIRFYGEAGFDERLVKLEAEGRVTLMRILDSEG